MKNLVKIKWYWQIPIWALIILGVIMFIPLETGTTNILGYQSLSNLTPIPSIIFWVISIILYGVARKRVKVYKLT